MITPAFYAARFRRQLALGGLGVLGVVVAMVAVLAALALSPIGRDFALKQLRSALATTDATRLSFGAVSGHWPQSLVLDDVALADQDGVWLNVRRVKLSWYPMALLGGYLDVESLSIDEPVAVRPPKAQGARTHTVSRFPRTGFALPKLPVSVNVEKVTIKDARIEAPAEIAFGATGAVSLTKGAGRVALSLRRTDGIDEHLELDAAVDRQRHALKLDLDGLAAPDGLFAYFAGVDTLPAIEIKAIGAGPPERWNLNGHVHAGEWGRLTFDGAIAWTDLFDAKFRGSYTHADALPAPWATLLGRQASFTAAAHTSAQNVVLHADIAGEAVKASVSLDRQTSGDVSGNIVAKTLAPLRLENGSIVGPLDASGSVSGPLDLPRVDMVVTTDHLRMDDFDMEALRVTVKALAGRNDRTLAVTAAGESKTFAFNAGRGFHPGAPRAEFSAKASLAADGTWSVPKLLLSLPGAVLDGSATVRPFDGEANAKLIATDLRSLAVFADTDLSGRADLTIGARWSRDGLGLAISGKAHDAVVSGIDFGALAGDSAHLAVDVSHTPDAPWVLESGSIVGANGFRAMAVGPVTRQVDLSGMLEGDLAGLSPQVGLTLAGPFKARVAVRGHWSSPAITAHLESPNAQVVGMDVGQLRADFNPPEEGVGAGQKVAGVLSLQTEAPFGQITAAGRIAELQDRTLEISDLAANLFGGTVTGHLKLPKSQARPVGDVTVVFPDLSELSGFLAGAPRRAQGHFRASLALRDQEGLPALKADLVASGISSPSDHVSLAALTASATVAHDGEIDTHVKLTEAQVYAFNRPFRAGSAVIVAKGPPQRLAVSADCANIADGTGQLSAAGVVNWPAQTATVNTLAATLWSTPIALTKPARIDFSQRPAFPDVAITVADGSLALRLEPAKAKRGFVAEATGHRLPLVFFGRALDTGWSHGTLDVALALDTVSARPHGTFKVTLSDAVFVQNGLADVTPMAGEATGQWDGRTLSITATSDHTASLPFELKASLPLGVDSERSVMMRPEGPVSARLRWSGRMAAFWALLPIDMHRLDGDGAFDIFASGTWAQPVVTGHMTVQRGTYENLETGTRLYDVALDLSANEENADLSLTGRDHGGGSISGKGRIALKPTEHFPMSAQLDLHHARILGLDDLTASASGSLSLTGSFARLKLSGDLSIDGVEAHIPDRLPQTVTTLPVEYVNGQRIIVIGDGQTESKSTPIDLALTITVPGRAYLRGRGLTSEWKGDVTVFGTLATPDVKGTISLVRGTLAFAGRTFQLSRGRVSFAGGTDIDPDLDVAAERTVQSNTVGLELSGRASSPHVAITSSPALPQDEAMSLLLFGKSATTLTPLELIDVTRGVAELSGSDPLGGGLGLLDKTRSTFGFDVLSVDVDDSSGTAQSVAGSAAVTAGRYLTDKVYVGVKQGARSGSSAVQLEVELSPHITANTEVSPDSQSSGINWKWDY